MKSRANASFWNAYRRLPPDVRTQARKQYRLWRGSPHHPSLRFKKVAADAWSVRISARYRALAAEEAGVLVWFWIGTHDDYERLMSE